MFLFLTSFFSCAQWAVSHFVACLLALVRWYNYIKYLAYLDFIFHFYFIFNDLDQPTRRKNIAVFFSCVVLCRIFDFVILVLVLYCTIHDHIRLWFISLCVVLRCVCALCICQCFFAVINRCQRILFVCFCSVSFVRFIRSFIRLAARSHSFANSLSFPLFRSCCVSFFHFRVFFACIACLLPWRRRRRRRAVVVCHWLPNLYYTHSRALARHSHFYVKHFLCSMSSLLSIELNRWVDFKWIGRADSSFFSNCFSSVCISPFSSKRFSVNVCALWIQIFLFFFLCFYEEKKLRFRYMIIVCVCARISRHKTEYRTITCWLGSWRPVFVSWHLYTLMVSRLFQR